MKVSTVMNALPRYAPRHWLEDLRSLAELNSRAQTLPFAGQTPPPANVNLVRNQPAGDINTQKIELQAACGGKKRLAWIFGADAELLELTLKSDENEAAWLAPDRNPCNPVLLLANIRGRQSEPLDAQYAYFIDEFTEESLVRCARSVAGETSGDQERGGDPVQEQCRHIALRMFYALQEYDSGLSRKAAREQNLANIRENSEPGTDGFAKARNVYQSYTQPLTPAGKLIFNSVRLYIERQETAAYNVSFNHPGHREAVCSAVQSLADSPSALSKIWHDAAAFVRSLARRQFEPALPEQGGQRGLKEAGHGL